MKYCDKCKHGSISGFLEPCRSCWEAWSEPDNILADPPSFELDEPKKDCRTCVFDNSGAEWCLACSDQSMHKTAQAHLPTAPDLVNQPSHYQHGSIETIDIIRTMLTPEEFRGYLKGNILKYRERAPYKGKTDEDYAKALKYYEWLMEEFEG